MAKRNGFKECPGGRRPDPQLRSIWAENVAGRSVLGRQMTTVEPTVVRTRTVRGIRETTNPMRPVLRKTYEVA